MNVSFNALGPMRVLAMQPGDLTPAMRRVGDAFEQAAIKNGFMERYAQAIGNLIVRQKASIDVVESIADEPVNEHDATMLTELKAAQYAEAYTACRLSNFEQAMTGRPYVEAIRLCRLEQQDGSVVTGELPGSRAVVGILAPASERHDKPIAPFTTDDLRFAIGAAANMYMNGFRLNAASYDAYTLWAANDGLRFSAP